MEFRAPKEASHGNAHAMKYLTKNLSDKESGKRIVEQLFEELGNSIEIYPYWHPLITAPDYSGTGIALSLSELDVYRGIDHTIRFVRGFVTCPYSKERAAKLVEKISEVAGLGAGLLDSPLYADNAYPVQVTAYNVELEADGTIRTRDALAWFTQTAVKNAQSAKIAETWWNIRTEILGSPSGSRSSLFVNQHAGAHMRKILETLNGSGMFGPILEDSLDMLSQKKRNRINETLLHAAIDAWDNINNEFEFELRGEKCRVLITDISGDGSEYSFGLDIGEFDLSVRGYYFLKSKEFTYTDPRGKRAIAEKFL